jgi:hypothetical protein
MEFTDFTTLGRPIDPRYPTNVAISIVGFVVAAGGAVYRILAGDSWLDGILWGAGAALAVFLSWALARELDPDYDLAAFAGAALALPALIWLGQPAFLALFWVLLLVRVVDRTVGLPARPLDSLALVGLAGWLAWQGSWPAPLLTGVAFLLDALLPPSDPRRDGDTQRRHLSLASIAVAAAVAAAIWRGDGHAGAPLSAGAWAGLAVASVLFLVVIATSRRVTSVCDARGQPLVAARVQADQALALLAGLLFAWQQGADGVQALAPLWAAMLGAALWRIGTLVTGRRGEAG